MSMTKSKRLIAYAAVLCAGALGGGFRSVPPTAAQAAPPILRPLSSAEGERGITEPSENLELGFYLPGVILEAPAKQGDVVKKGQLLVKQDDSVEQAELIVRLQEMQEALLQITASEKDYENKKVAFVRQEGLMKKGNTARSEYETAKLEMEIAEVRAQLSKETLKKAEAQIQEIRARLTFREIRSPVDGIVRRIDAGVGENTDTQKPAIYVVKNDPLWVKVDLESQKAKALKLGNVTELQVRYDGEQEWQPARIFYFDPVVDAASDTQTIRLEMPNPKGYPSGLQVFVKLPEPVAAAGANR